MIWFCYREPTTGRWQGNVEGTVWVNTMREAYRIEFTGDCPNPDALRRWFVLRDVRFTDNNPVIPSIHDRVVDEVYATRVTFRWLGGGCGRWRQA